MTQVEASKATGIPQSTISTAEREGHGSADTPVYAKAFGVDAHWLATGEGAMLPVHGLLNSEVTISPQNLRKVKLIKLQEAGMYFDILANPGIPATEFCGIESGPRTFAVLMPNISSSQDIPEGAVLLVDPDLEPEEEDWIVATQDGHNVVKKVMRDGADLYLESPIKPRSLDTVTVLGTVTGYTVTTGKRRS